MNQDSQNISTNTHRASGMNGVNNTFNPKLSETGLAQTSTNIFIYANGGVVGMIQSFSISESRNINKLQAIGYEGVVQAVPSNTNGGQLSVTRMALYGANLFRALGGTTTGGTGTILGKKVHNKPGLDTLSDHTLDGGDTGPEMESLNVFRTLKDQRVPLEIVAKTLMDGSTGECYEERYVDCWLSSYSKSFTVSQITVAENATIQYGDVY